MGRFCATARYPARHLDTPIFLDFKELSPPVATYPHDYRNLDAVAAIFFGAIERVVGLRQQVGQVGRPID
jgi:hypothetical protein